MVADPAVGFVPPPYPYDRLDALKRLADALPGGVVDCSIGTPCDPVPEVAARAAADAASPARSATRRRSGSAALRERGRGVDRPPLRRRGRRRRTSVACVGTKELVASLPHLLRLRDPPRDTVLYPGDRVPDLRDGRDARRAAARCRSRSTPTGTSTSTRSPTPTPSARSLLWINEPGNPTVVGRRRRAASRAVAAWARARGIVVASDECYAEFAPEPATILAQRPRRRARGAQRCRSARTWPGMRVGFYAGDPDLVTYLVETRKHAGLMAPTPMQAAAAAALGDDEHVAVQRAPLRGTPRARASTASPRTASSTTAARARFYLWLRADDGADDGWEIAARLAHDAGLLVSPGDLYGAAGADHVRLALVQPRDRLELALDRLARRAS